MTNDNFMALSAASDLLNISETSIKDMISSGDFDSSRGAYDKPVVSKMSIQRYALKNDIKLDEDYAENFTVAEACKLLRVEEVRLHQLIQKGKLSHKVEGGQMKVCGKTVAECLKSGGYRYE